MASVTASATASLKVPVMEAMETAEPSTPNGTTEETGDENAESGGDAAWETGSFYEDVFEQFGDEQYGIQGADICTLEESHKYKKLLRSVGVDEFIMRTIEAGIISARKLVTAFGIPHHSFLEGAPDDAYYPLLGMGIQRELRKRVKLQEYNTIDDAVSLLKRAKNIVVITGAGISTSLGIPDFRSKNTGLYSQLEHLGLSDPQEVFDISQFREDPTVFYTVAKDILPSTKKFSPTHAFIRLLQDKDKLLTNYTQNIDNLEGHAGISEDKLIQCHGSFATATCQQCKHRVNGDVIHTEIKAGQVPKCPACIRRLQQIRPFGLKRKRSSHHCHYKKKRPDYEDSTSGEEEQPETEIAGVMKPDITFFGEDLPDKFHDRLTKHDIDAADLVVVIGTSLKVAPVSEVPNVIPATVPQLYISRDPCKHIDFDMELMGDCDVVVAELCERAGWELRHEMIPLDQKVEVRLVEDCASSSRWQFTAGRAGRCEGGDEGGDEGEVEVEGEGEAKGLRNGRVEKSLSLKLETTPTLERKSVLEVDSGEEGEERTINPWEERIEKEEEEEREIERELERQAKEALKKLEEEKVLQMEEQPPDDDITDNGEESEREGKEEENEGFVHIDHIMFSETDGEVEEVEKPRKEHEQGGMRSKVESGGPGSKADEATWTRKM